MTQERFNMIELCIVLTNLLVVVASLIVAMVTMEDIVKDGNKTIVELVKAMVRLNRQKETEK